MSNILPQNGLTVVAMACLAGIIYSVGVIVYRLFFHPLASYPGPLLGRITDWYSVIRSAAGDRHIHFLELHRKHGKTFALLASLPGRPWVDNEQDHLFVLAPTGFL